MGSEAGGREGWSEDYISNPRPPCLFFFWNSPISSQKYKTTGNSTWRFLGHPRNSTLLLINPWKFDMLFLWYPLIEIPYPQPFCLVFFWNSPFTVNFVILLQLSGWSFFFFFFGHLAIPSKNKFSLFFWRSWNHEKHVNILSEIYFLEAHIWLINCI